jgi:hypothetical protein
MQENAKTFHTTLEKFLKSNGVIMYMSLMMPDPATFILYMQNGWHASAGPAHIRDRVQKPLLQELFKQRSGK